MFPPDPLSRYCTTDKSLFKATFPCDPYHWTINLPNGKYNIKVTAGDYGYAYACGLVVNKGTIIQEFLNKGQFTTKSKDILVMDGKLTLE